jgi:hypothetical protein
MAQIGLSYTPSGGSPVYNIVLEEFGDRVIPRTYDGSASFAKSANGASLLQGPAYKQKYVWAITSLVTDVLAAEFDAMFQAWDTDRAAGLPAVCGIADTTFGPQVNTEVLFSTPPSYTYMGPKLTLIAFGLQEV